jgi:hypothetical protein
MIKVVLFCGICFLFFAIGFGVGVESTEDCLCEITQNLLSSSYQANPNALDEVRELEILTIQEKTLS